MIKVLVICNDTDGVGKYRMLDPHLCLDDPEIDVEIRLIFDGTLNLVNEGFTRQFNIIFFNKAIPFAKKEFEDEFFRIVKKYNIKLLYDLDDYWILNSSHLNYKAWKDSKADQMTEKYIKLVDAVITTTELFATRIRELNPNVYVLPNGVNLKEQQSQVNKKNVNDRLKIIWSGGISHRPDIALLKPSFQSFDKEILNGAQIIMAGYDLRMRTPQGTFKSDPKTNEWTNFENVFTNNGKWILNPKHKEFLNKYDDKDYGYSDEFKNEFYNRRWTMNIVEFATHLDYADILLAPLKNNHIFNFYKSNLKIVDAGSKKCMIMASNYGPYTIDDIEGKKDGKVKGILIDESDKLGWYNKIKWCLNNKSAVEDMTETLHEYVKEKYDINVINKKRAEVYKMVVNK